VTQKEKVEYEREKVRRVEGNAKKEGDLLKILVNELHREIEGKDEHLKEVMTQLREAKDDIVKLEEANGRLKGQAISKWVDAAEADFDSMFQEEFALLRGSRDPSTRQSSERHTAESTPHPPDIIFQDAEEWLDPSSPELPPNHQSLQHRASSILSKANILSKARSWHLLAGAFTALILALVYRVMVHTGV